MLKGSAVAAGALMACGATAAVAEEAGSYQYAKTLDEVAGFAQIETDVLVIGGGGAGICASLAAAEAGAKVVIHHEQRKDPRRGHRPAGGCPR